VVDFETNKKGFGPGVNRETSTGSRVMVGRVVGVNEGITVRLGVTPGGSVLVGASVLTANRSGVFVYESEINVTVDWGELAIAGAEVGCRKNGRSDRAEQPTRINANMATTIFFMNSS
jgi:hypothetical protein